MDWTKWITDEVLEDHVKKPIKIDIADFSKKFDIKITIAVLKKEK